MNTTEPTVHPMVVQKSKLTWMTTSQQYLNGGVTYTVTLLIVIILLMNTAEPTVLSMVVYNPKLT